MPAPDRCFGELSVVRVVGVVGVVRVVKRPGAVKGVLTYIQI